MQIRPATPADAEAVMQITHQTIRSVYPHYYPAGAVAFFLQHHCAENIRKDIAENNVFLCISDDGQAVGTVSVKENEIGRLFVLPAFQGQGYGCALIAFAEQRIAAQYPEAVLDASFSAKALYLRHGWEDTGYHKIACENGDFLCHDTMRKRLVQEQSHTGGTIR